MSAKQAAAAVIPVKTGIQNFTHRLDSRLRGNDACFGVAWKDGLP
jgi:hypothetical protein